MDPHLGIIPKIPGRNHQSTGGRDQNLPDVILIPEDINHHVIHELSTTSTPISLHRDHLIGIVRGLPSAARDMAVDPIMIGILIVDAANLPITEGAEIPVVIEQLAADRMIAERALS